MAASPVPSPKEVNAQQVDLETQTAGFWGRLLRVCYVLNNYYPATKGSVSMYHYTRIDDLEYENSARFENLASANPSLGYLSDAAIAMRGTLLAGTGERFFRLAVYPLVLHADAAWAAEYLMNQAGFSEGGSSNV